MPRDTDNKSLLLCNLRSIKPTASATGQDLHNWCLHGKAEKTANYICATAALPGTYAPLHLVLFSHTAPAMSLCIRHDTSSSPPAQEPFRNERTWPGLLVSKTLCHEQGQKCVARATEADKGPDMTERPLAGSR